MGIQVNNIAKNIPRATPLNVGLPQECRNVVVYRLFVAYITSKEWHRSKKKCHAKLGRENNT